jgi:hypothetical protein
MEEILEPRQKAFSGLELENELLELEIKRQQVLSKLKESRINSRELERFQSYRQEAVDILSQFTFNVWEKQISRHFNLKHIFTETGYSLRNSFEWIDDNELKITFPAFDDVNNPGRFKLDEMHVWILPSVNQAIADAFILKKRVERATSIIGDMHRTAGTTYVFLSAKGYVKRGKLPNGDFVFAGISKSAKWALTRLFRILKNRILKRLKTLWFKLRLTEKTDLRNPSSYASWSNLENTCTYNASLILFGGSPIDLSGGMQRTILSLMRVACECEAFEFHRLEEREIAEDDMFTMSSSCNTSSIVNRSYSLQRKSSEFKGSEGEVRWKRDKETT